MPQYVISAYRSKLDSAATPFLVARMSSSDSVKLVAKIAGRELIKQNPDHGLCTNHCVSVRDLDANVLYHAGFERYAGWHDSVNDIYVVTCLAEDVIKRPLDLHLSASLACSSSIENTTKPAPTKPKPIIEPFVLEITSLSVVPQFSVWASYTHFLRQGCPILTRTKPEDAVAACLDFMGNVSDPGNPYHEYTVQNERKYSQAEKKLLVALKQPNARITRQNDGYSISRTDSIDIFGQTIRDALIAFSRPDIAADNDGRSVDHLIKQVIAADATSQVKGHTDCTPTAASVFGASADANQMVEELRRMSIEMRRMSAANEPVIITVQVGNNKPVKLITTSVTLPAKKDFLVQTSTLPWLKKVPDIRVKAYTADQAIAKAVRTLEKMKAIPVERIQISAEQSDDKIHASTVYNVAGSNIIITSYHLLTAKE